MKIALGDRARAFAAQISEMIGQNIDGCYQCGKCTAGCPLAYTMEVPPHEIVRKGIIHCPERRQLFVEFTVVENLEMGAFLRSDKGKIKGDLEHVYRLFPVLQERKNQLAGTLSGGEQQMLAIGRALMSGPRLFMLDEPSMGLSPLMKNVLVEGIKSIWKTGLTVLIVEQDASLTLNLVERVYILEHGRVGLEGKSRDLMNNEEVKRVYFQLG